jgi:HPt (histidine-containing phosphotransfer) domain-containing protein
MSNDKSHHYFSESVVQNMPAEVMTVASKMHLKIGPTKEVLSLYFEDADIIISRTNKEIRETTPALEDVSHLTHSLKGMSQNLGLSSLAIQCERVEASIVKHDINIILHTISELREEYDRVRNLCTNWLFENKSC